MTIGISCCHHKVGLVLENGIHMVEEVFEQLGMSLPSTIQKIPSGVESCLTKDPLALTLSLAFKDVSEPLTADVWIASHSRLCCNSVSGLLAHLS